MLHSETAFRDTLPAGFDGLFSWDWLEGCFGETNIKAMDLDAIVERRGRFLIFETKRPGVDIPTGQRLTLEARFKTGLFTVVELWGKETPERFRAWTPPGFETAQRKTTRPTVWDGVAITNNNEHKKFVKAWFEYANNFRDDRH